MSQPKGHVSMTTLESSILKGARSGIAAERPLVVYTPPSIAGSPSLFPTLYCLAAWTNAGRSMMQWSAFKEPLSEKLDRLILQKKIPPCVVVCPDLYLDYGGSQYINSSFAGDHGDHIAKEVIPYIEKNFPVKKGAEHRGVFGISSGGFGALRFVMDYDDLFSVSYCHSGDMGFDTLYGSDMPSLANGLARYDSDPQTFINSCRSATRVSGGDIHLLMLLGMAAFYSPNPDSRWGYDLPIDLRTCTLKPEVWDLWLSHDPVVRVEKEQVRHRLSKLRYLHFECGFRDQYNLHFGARRLSDKLKDYGVKHEHAEFDGTHSGLIYRFDTSLPKMLEHLV